MKIKLLVFLMSFLPLAAVADRLDSIHNALENSPQIQEKIYIHTDNTCYFIGDTLWYKAYVLRSDDMRYTDLSKILYVELLSPDGLVVERQRIVISGKGFTCGDFVLRDSLYSGYYELRAYTRWQLNFNVTHRSFTRDDALKFYSKRVANDFYRDWEGLYSRVLPVYAKPDDDGNYDARYMYARPKENIIKSAAEKLNVAFYSEGGRLVKGVRGRVAFEVTDQNGQAVDVSGRLGGGTKISTTYMGRGVFDVVPDGSPLAAVFTWHGKDYSFKLPAAENTGVALRLSDGRLTVDADAGCAGQAGLAILCRGSLCHFERIDLSRHPLTFTIDPQSLNLPIGINEAVVYDADGNIMASRLFFINNNDMVAKLKVSTYKTDLQPYERGGVDVVMADSLTAPRTLSVSVRDSRTDDTSYDDGNMLTDLLLSSELRGFIASPSYYFAADDAAHRDALDLLMMVQGWRRYKRVDKLRYEPERTFTIDGDVFKLRNVDMTDIDDVTNDADKTTTTDAMIAQTDEATGQTSGSGTEDSSDSEDESSDVDGALASSSADVDFANETGANYGDNRIRNEVLLEAEIEKEGKSAGLIQKTTHRGHFMFQIPPFYGSAILFMKAYQEKDSANKCMASRKDKYATNERAYPDYYVKRNLFYPIFSKPYSYYQTHTPPFKASADNEGDVAVPQNSKLNGDHTLQTVDVKARRRGRRGIDYTKPAFVMDTYELYNLVTDYGLSWGVLQFMNFPSQAATYMYGNMGRTNQFNIRAMMDGTSFYRNYTSTVQEYDRMVAKTALYDNMTLSRQLNVRAFSDYEPRNAGGVVENHNSPDVTFIFETVPDNGKRYTYRDRRFILHGFDSPDEFYSPDYSGKTPTKSEDYRRTLYWNPNLKPDADGHFRVSFFNNSRETRVKVSVAGVTSDGKIAVDEGGCP